MLTAPKQGQQLHTWILQVSRTLVIEGYSQDKAIELMIDATKQSGRTSQDINAEIENAVIGAIEWFKVHPNASASPYVRQRHRKKLPTISLTDPFWRQDSRPEYLPMDASFKTEVIHEASQLPKPNGRFSFVELFSNINFLLCCCVKVNDPKILPIRRWLSIGFQTQQFIVPNFCLSINRGKCDLNMGASLYQVIEFDQDNIEDQFKLLATLALELPLAMIVYSGNKSLHGWFPCYHLSRRDHRSFFRLATLLGADVQLRIPSQYVRMPWGRNRKTNKVQRVLYYNGEVIQEHNAIVREDLL
jgi:hypothetical protein